jgi:hypothetical protein
VSDSKYEKSVIFHHTFLIQCEKSEIFPVLTESSKANLTSKPPWDIDDVGCWLFFVSKS